MLSKEKQDQIRKKMEELQVFEKDLEEKFILGQGSGGQKINKTSSCVYIKHIPTSVEVKCQHTRSREENRFFARRKLCEIIESKTETAIQKQKQFIAKIKRQKRKRSKKSKEKMLASKKIKSEKKQLRKNISQDH